MRHPDRLSAVSLAALRHLDLSQAFAQPGPAIDVLSRDLQLLWDEYRSGDPNDRKVGTIDLASGAYLQWIGYDSVVVVECSSDTYLPPESRLGEATIRTALGAGFNPPDEDEPNFWMSVERRSDLGRAAFSMVALLTAGFGVYAG